MTEMGGRSIEISRRESGPNAMDAQGSEECCPTEDICEYRGRRLPHPVAA